MLADLLPWLVRTGRIRAQTQVVLELPWLGRRIDLVLSTGRGDVTAFELKLSSTGRALEQALYNGHSATRSFIVLGSDPTRANLEVAGALGIGVIVVNGVVRLVRSSPPRTANAELAARMRGVVRDYAETRV